MLKSCCITVSDSVANMTKKKTQNCKRPGDVIARWVYGAVLPLSSGNICPSASKAVDKWAAGELFSNYLLASIGSVLGSIACRLHSLGLPGATSYIHCSVCCTPLGTAIAPESSNFLQIFFVSRPMSFSIWPQRRTGEITQAMPTRT